MKWIRVSLEEKNMEEFRGNETICIDWWEATEEVRDMKNVAQEPLRGSAVRWLIYDTLTCVYPLLFLFLFFIVDLFF